MTKFCKLKIKFRFLIGARNNQAKFTVTVQCSWS